MKPWLLFLGFLMGISLAVQPMALAQFPADNDQFAKALTLDGNGDYLEVPDAALLNFGTETDITLELWFRKNTYAGVFNLINKQGGGTGWKLDIGFYHPLDGSFNGNTVVVGRATPSGYTSNIFYVGTNLLRDKWYHLAVTMDRTLTETKIYLSDGDQLYTNSSDDIPEAGLDLSTPGYALGIGGRPNDTNASRWFDGNIDEVRIWKKVRTESELLAAKDAPLDPTYYADPDSGLALYFRFDLIEDLGVGGQGADIRDLCPQGNHGMLQGDAAVPVEALDVPEAFVLTQNYPNPFNASTTIRYMLPQSSFVMLAIYDLLGKEVETLVQEQRPVGEHAVLWDAGDLPSGLYFARLEAGDYVATRPLVLQK